MRAVSSVQRAKRSAVIVAGLACSVALIAPAASAAAGAGVASPATITPNMCTSGYFSDIDHDYGNIFHQVGSTYTVENATSSNITETFTNTWTGSVSSTLSASLRVSLNDIISDAKADISSSITASQTKSTTVSVQAIASPGKYTYGKYGAFQRKLDVESYYMSGGCSASQYEYATAYLDDGWGWQFTTSAI